MQELSKGQRDALLFGAVTGPMAVACGGRSLLWAIPALAAAALIYALVRRVLPEGKSLAEYMPVWLLIPEFLFLILAAAKTAAHATACWPEGASWPLFPLALLALAGASAWQQTDGVGRCAVLLGLGCALFYAVVLPASVPEASLPEEPGPWQEGVPVLLTALSAVCGLFLPSKKGGGRLWAGIVVFTLLLLLCAAGKSGETPFLTAVKGIELFGVLQRFESLASCAMTVGLFLMLALLAAAGGEIGHALGIGKIGGAAVVIPAAVIVFWANEIHDALFAGGALVFWGLIPLLLLPVVAGKGNEKTS